MYQDIWINGQCVKSGKRECANRYKIIKPHFRYLFSVLEIGANNCYFSLRLIEDFNCRSVAFEFDHFDKRMEIVNANDTDRLMLIKRKLKFSDLDILAACGQFDIVLCMSVLHHVPGNPNDWIKKIRRIAPLSIFEFALSDSKRTIKYDIPEDGTLIGYGDSHLKGNYKRPIYLYKNT